MPRPLNLNSPRQGQAAVLRVAAELGFRGASIAFPAVDDAGVDLVVLPGVRVQVKSAYLRKHHRVYPEGAYWFKFVSGPIVTGNNTIKRRGPRQFSHQCDVIVLMGIDESRFWIVPAALLDGKSLCVVGPPPKGAAKPRGETTGRFSTVKQIRECEGRWDRLVR